MSIGNFDTHRMRKVTATMLCVLIGITAGLLIYSAICPPPGKIDPDMFQLVPWTFAFCTLWVAWEAILEGLGVKYSHGDTTFEVTRDKDSE